MTEIYPTLQNALLRCRNGDDSELAQLLNNLKDLDFLTKIDDPTASEEGYMPVNLRKLLISAAENIAMTKSADAIVYLANSPYYAMVDFDGTLRRHVLIEAAGHVVKPNVQLLRFLEKEVAVEEGDNRMVAVGALSDIGTPEAINILRDRVFSSIVSAEEDELLELNLYQYTIELGRNRDKMPVLTFMLDSLYQQGLEEPVTECIVEDFIKRGPDQEHHVKLAPLTKETPNAITIAHKMIHWMILNGEELEEWGDFTGIASRISVLLGLDPTEPGSGESHDVRSWAIERFENALETESDENRRREIQNALNALKQI